MKVAALTIENFRGIKSGRVVLVDEAQDLSASALP